MAHYRARDIVYMARPLPGPKSHFPGRYLIAELALPFMVNGLNWANQIYSPGRPFSLFVLLVVSTYNKDSTLQPIHLSRPIVSIPRLPDPTSHLATTQLNSELKMRRKTT